MSVLAAALAGVLAAPAAAADEPKLAIQAWSLHKEMDVDPDATLAKFRAMGFRHVELYGLHGRTPAQMKALLDKHGLTAPATHVSLAALKANPAEVAAQAKAIGAKYAGVAWAKSSKGDWTVAEVDDLAATYKAACPAFKAAGVTPMYHIHGYEFIAEPGGQGTMFDRLLRQTPKECMAIEVDVLWAVRPGVDPAKLIEKLGDRAALLHVKDQRKGAPTNDHSGGAPEEDNVPVGSGMVDWPAVVAASKKAGVKWYVVEDESTDPAANIPKSVAYLKSIGVR
jgi:sugar phosphate isomerase/epimerase